MAINIKQATQRYVKEAKAAFIYVGEDGTEQTEDIRVRFWSSTTADWKKQAEAGKDGPRFDADLLAERIESLPDIVDDKGKPVKITAEFLNELNLQNIRTLVATILSSDRGE